MGGLNELFQQYDVLAAFFMTIKLSFWSTLGALLLGTVVAILRVSPIKVFQFSAAVFVNLLINTPLTLVVFFCYFGWHVALKINLAPKDALQSTHSYIWGIVALAVYHSAFIAENIRSGINTVPQGQAEAARAIGLNFSQSLGSVVLPQAMRAAIAPIGNTIIALTKNTTIVATIGVVEMAYLMKDMLEFSPQYLGIIFLVIAAGFIVMTLPLGIIFTVLSRKLVVQR